MKVISEKINYFQIFFSDLPSPVEKYGPTNGLRIPGSYILIKSYTY